MNEQWRGAWTAALDELEMDVASTEAMLADVRRMNEMPAADPWQPRPDLGTLPAELRPRVDEIITRQLRLAEEISRRLTATRLQQAATSKIETGERIKRPIYLDRAM